VRRLEALRRPLAGAAPAVDPYPTAGGAGDAASGLRVEQLVVRFGGIVAVDGVDLLAPAGRLTSLLGPNGAGKTTTFNACTGLVRPTSGRVHLLGEDVTDLPSHVRARRGLGRTFQRMELFDSLPVSDNVALGREAAFAGSKPWQQIVAPRDERRQTAEAAEAAIERPSELSTGQRRLVELARAVAGGFRVLLLDEPSSGLDKAETERFGEILRSLVDQRGCALLVVEHDMALVMSVSDYIYVLDFGQPIFEGTPEEVASSEVVRAAYLGSEDLEREA
jgi:ABC-type branched-subunit amino acid transport system ATPase component